VEEELEQGLPYIQANPDQLKQAFYNVIKNAVQAMPRGGILQVKTTLVDGYLAVCFEDNGSGISHEDMAHITEPYFTRKKSGSGLGLFIVQRVIHEHGGQVELHSEPGRGTTVQILLPLTERRVRMLPAGGGDINDAVEVPTAEKTAEKPVVVETPPEKPKSTKRQGKRNERAER
jgi:signal transduction histidine kinase